MNDSVHGGELDPLEEQTISLEVEVFQLHHLLWTLRYFIHRKRPAAEYEHVLRECYETSCRMVTRCKSLADLRWKERMKPQDTKMTDGQAPEAGGGGGCNGGTVPLLRVPVGTVFPPQRLRAFEQDLAAIDPDDLAVQLDLPRG